MAKHRQQNREASSAKQTTQQRRRPPSLILLGTTAAALSTVLVFGHATNNTVDSSQLQLAASTIGIGGRGDPAAAKVPNKLRGHVVDDLSPTFPLTTRRHLSSTTASPRVSRCWTGRSGIRLATIRPTAVPCCRRLFGRGIVAEKVRRELDPSQPDAPSKGRPALRDDRVAECPERRHLLAIARPEDPVLRDVERRRATVARTAPHM